MRIVLNGFAFLTLCGFFGSPDPAWAEHFAPHDWGGSSLTLNDGDVIWGTHQNLGTLTIPVDAEVRVMPYDGSTLGFGFVKIEAVTVIIDGKISARGAGYPAGAGGGGGGGAVQARQDRTRGEGGGGGRGETPSQDGRDGISGQRGDDEPGGDGGLGGQGVGPFGGAGGTAGKGRSDHSGGEGERGRDGGYNETEGNTDVTTDTSLLMGSGGGGGGGGAGGGTKEGPFYDPVWYGGGGGGGGGAAGGSGGGYIKLITSDLLILRGEIDTSGTLGENGKPGEAGEVQGDDAFGGDGGDGADVGEPGDGEGGKGGEADEDAKAGGRGGDGGGGAGGGILLACPRENGMFVTGSINASGGGGSLSNGGTVKIMYVGKEPIVDADIRSGRLYEGFLYFEPTPTPTLPATPTPEPTPSPTPLRSDLNRDGVIDFRDLLLFQQDWRKQK